MPNLIKEAMFSAGVFLDLLSETTDDYLYMWDIQNGTFYVSENAYDDFGIDRSIENDVLTIWGSVMVAEDLKLWLEDLQLIQAGVKDYHDMEYRVYRKTGQIIWVSCRGKVKTDEQNRPLFMIGRISNIGKQNYQPQIDTSTRKVIGAEALLRWHSPKHGEVSPIEFIPFLEENHLIIQVGKWVLEEGAKQCLEWQKYDPDFTMSINVSYVQLKENALLEYLKNEHIPKVSAKNLILELTESCWVPNLHFLNQEFKDMHEMGYGIAIDDFGTGYSSLSHLKELPANVIKIDRSFIKGLSKGSYEYIFLEYIVKLAHIIHLKVCVEGVETKEEFDTVMQASPDYIQGYLFGRPVCAREFESLYFASPKER